MRFSIHKQEEKLNGEQRAYHRLKQRKKDKPYYQRYYTLYIIVLILGWAANLLSGVTESSRIYAFYYDFLRSFTFADAGTWILVILTVGLIEIFHRIIATSYFKDLVENDIHTKDMTPKLLVMLIIALFSTTLSFHGGFELVRLTKQSPEPIAANLLSVEDLSNAYSPLVGDLKEDIQDFRKTREWKGRLSDKSARQWEDMKQKKQEIQIRQAEALTSLSSNNLEEQIRVDSLNQQRQQVYESQIDNRGYGLGILSILAVFILYACLWYDEEYQERKAIYLEKKFGSMSDPSPLPHSPIDNGFSHFSDKQQSNPTHSEHYQENGTELPKSEFIHPIGFYTETQRQEMNIQTNPSGQVWTDMDREISDRFTVPHTYRKGGKSVTVHYTLRMVNSRIAQYEREIADAFHRHLEQSVLENRQNWLRYWQQKRVELLQKST